MHKKFTDELLQERREKKIHIIRKGGIKFGVKKSSRFPATFAFESLWPEPKSHF